jgi:predicted acylesterase/phospholipase RssA
MTGRPVALLVVAAAFAIAGCARSTAIEVHRATADPPCLVPVRDRDTLVGVALSGGGSRAALFAAGGLEALAGVRTPGGTSVLEEVAYVSSVSGGSLAASYYALNKPPRHVPALAPEGGVSPAYRAFFDRARGALAQDFEGALVRRHLSRLRWLNSSLAARSLFEVLHRDLLGETTMADLARREADGDGPGLIVNTTLYNNGRRLALTALPPAALRYDFFQDLHDSLRARGVPIEPTPLIAQRWEALLPLTPLDLHIDPCRVRLAGAVSASASFPPLIGPITLHVGGEDIYWHAGDGGLYENQGLESLLFLFLKQMQEGRARRALVITFDSSFPFSVGDRRLSQRARPFSLFTFDFSRVPSIMEERATTYQALFLRSLQLEGVIPDRRRLNVVFLRHTSARWRDDLADLPPVCRQEAPALTSAAAVVERIAEIPTRLRVPSACDRELLATAAHKLVAEHEPEIRAFLEGSGQFARGGETPPRPGPTGW